ncbi:MULTISPECIES: AbrB/MazE/SpoVT family DNA-binding domain-containing protein [Thiomonas]|uniref:Virulence-associated protein VapB-like protein n=1 Tax=Thiomonas delicata TaxID=364030 RepID=A0A238D095_THIDL|nr:MULTISPECIES: AbrB/MazE/SpoVT family DNA-binding domain-containing protein [Thiomonas]SBP86640.1 Virulence-associated protein VapB-like protein [Thiomonas delicata]
MDTAQRHVRLFRNGRNQAVRIPRDMELPTRDAVIRREGARLIIEPLPVLGLLATLADLPDLAEPFPDVDAELGALDDVAL